MCAPLLLDISSRHCRTVDWAAGCVNDNLNSSSRHCEIVARGEVLASGLKLFGSWNLTPFACRRPKSLPISHQLIRMWLTRTASRWLSLLNESLIAKVESKWITAKSKHILAFSERRNFCFFVILSLSCSFVVRRSQKDFEDRNEPDYRPSRITYTFDHDDVAVFIKTT